MKASVPRKRSLWVLLLGVLLLQCSSSRNEVSSPDPVSSQISADTAEQRQAREQMVREQIEARDVRDKRVLAAMRKVPRHLFVPPSLFPYA